MSAEASVVAFNGCPDCTVLGAVAAVRPGLAAVLVRTGAKALILSADPAGAIVQAQNIPYGTAFPVSPDGRLPCGRDARCIVTAALPDGRGILSAFELTEQGQWLDRSGTGGFVSATPRAVPVALEDRFGVAVQVSGDGRTVWQVLGWDGSRYSSIGCAPDAAAPDLSVLSSAECLS